MGDLAQRTMCRADPGSHPVRHLAPHSPIRVVDPNYFHPQNRTSDSCSVRQLSGVTGNCNCRSVLFRPHIKRCEQLASLVREKLMSETSNGYGIPSVSDRLSALRGTPQQQQPAATSSSPRKVRKEILIGALVATGGIALVLFLRGGSTPESLVTKVNAVVEGTTPLNTPTQLMSGEAFVPVAVESGNLPPVLKVGDQVRVIVTPDQNGTGTVRGLEETTVVHDIENPGDIGTRFVITVRAPEGVAAAIAASGPVLLAIISKEGQ